MPSQHDELRVSTLELFFDLVFGESVVAIGIALTRADVTFQVYGAAILGLVFAAGLWFLRFVTDPARAEGALGGAPVAARVRLALAGYF
jgi:low temperature requirement protein LtrA